MMVINLLLRQVMYEDISEIKVGTDVKESAVHRVKFGVYTSSETKDEVNKRRDEIKQLSEQYQR